MKIPRAVKRIWQEIQSGENLDIYITIPIAIVVAILGVFPSNNAIVQSATVAVLAVILGSILQNRRGNEHVQKLVEQLQSNKHLSDRFFSRDYDHSELRQYIRSHREVLFWGADFTRTIPLLKEDLEYALERGSSIRIMLLKPSSEAVRMHSYRCRDKTDQEVSNTVLTNLLILARIARRVPYGKLSVRVINFLPAVTMTAFDPKSSDGVLMARILTFRTPESERPAFRLSRVNDKSWFDSFIEQYDLAWEQAENIDLNTYKRDKSL